MGTDTYSACPVLAFCAYRYHLRLFYYTNRPRIGTPAIDPEACELQARVYRSHHPDLLDIAGEFDQIGSPTIREQIIDRIHPACPQIWDDATYTPGAWSSQASGSIAGVHPPDDFV